MMNSAGMVRDGRDGAQFRARQRVKAAHGLRGATTRPSRTSVRSENGSPALRAVHPLLGHSRTGLSPDRDVSSAELSSARQESLHFSGATYRFNSIELNAGYQHDALQARAASPASFDGNPQRVAGGSTPLSSPAFFSTVLQVSAAAENLALAAPGRPSPSPLVGSDQPVWPSTRQTAVASPASRPVDHDGAALQNSGNRPHHSPSASDQGAMGGKAAALPGRERWQAESDDDRCRDSLKDEQPHRGGRPDREDEDDERCEKENDQSDKEDDGKKPKNIIIFIRDQVKPEDLWLPRDWAKTHLPNQQWLKDNGLSFTNACTNSSMCTAARSTFFTSKFPAQHEVELVLSDIQNPILDVQPQLSPDLPNLATVLKGQGYDVAFLGKAHLSKTFTRIDGELVYQDLSAYGFSDWQGPDAGQDMEVQNAGGGFADNDGNYTQQAIDWIANRAESDASKPFCLVISLINPHDVLSYPLTYKDFGYDESWLQGDIKDLPPTVDEILRNNFKPTVQSQWNLAQQFAQPLLTDQQKLNYLNFYGNLLIDVDQKMGQILTALGKTEDPDDYSELLKETLIVSTSDHGEMGLSHGGLVQKMEVAYDEALKVPMVWSNPDYFHGGQETDALVSHVDFLPTLVNFLGFDSAYIGDQDFRGVDYSKILTYAHANQCMDGAPEVQDVVLYTFDDIYAGQDPALSANGNVEHGLLPAANRIQAVRSKDFKLVRYFSGDLPYAPENWEEEFYDLRENGGDYYPDRDSITGQQNIFKANPLELKNLAPSADAQRVAQGLPALATAFQLEAYRQMTLLLNQQIADRLNPLPPSPAVEPSVFVYAGGSMDGSVYQQGDSVSRLIADQAGQSLELAFNTRAHQSYSIVYKANDGSPVTLQSGIVGTNGPVYQYLTGLPADLALADIGIQWDNGIVPLA